MELWPLDEDDYNAIEAERLDKQRSEEERQFEREFLEQQDRENAIEDQDILDHHWRESMEQDPDAQLAWEKFVGNDTQEAVEELAERAFLEKLGQGIAIEGTSTQSFHPVSPDSNAMPFTGAAPT